MSQQKILPLTLHSDEIGEGKDWLDVTQTVMAAIDSRVPNIRPDILAVMIQEIKR